MISPRRKWADGVTRAVIAARVKQLRRSLSMTQAELAEGCGLSAAHLCHFERGRRIPSVENLVRLAAALHTTTDYLCGLSHDPHPSDKN